MRRLWKTLCMIHESFWMTVSVAVFLWLGWLVLSEGWELARWDSHVEKQNGQFYRVKAPRQYAFNVPLDPTVRVEECEDPLSPPAWAKAIGHSIDWVGEWLRKNPPRSQDRWAVDARVKGAIAPVPRIPARLPGFLPMTRRESAVSAGGWLERRGASPVK